MNEDATAARQSQIPTQLDNLDKEISRANDIRSSIQVSLELVVRPPEPPSEESGTLDEELAPFAQRLRNLTCQLMRINNDNENLLSRIEL